MNKLLTPWKYTICFCIHKSSVLMVYRKNQPNQSLWNGLGGKIEVGETPRENIYREIQEESGINLKDADSVTFAGMVTWDKDDIYTPSDGMYAYIAKFRDNYNLLHTNRDTREGLLSWKSIAWISDMRNKEVVSNVPYFFPLMMHSNIPMEFAMISEDHTLKEMHAKPIPQEVLEKLHI